MMLTIVNQVKVHSDDRGFVFEPLGKHALQIQRNAHVVISQPGAVRGNHYHLKGTETIAVMGPALVRIKKGDQQQDVEVPAQNVFQFTFPPKVSHAIKNTGGKPNLLIAFNTLERDPGKPDLVEEILIEH